MASAKQLAARRKFARIMKSGGFKKRKASIKPLGKKTKKKSSVAKSRGRVKKRKTNKVEAKRKSVKRNSVKSILGSSTLKKVALGVGGATLATAMISFIAPNSSISKFAAPAGAYALGGLEGIIGQFALGMLRPRSTGNQNVAPQMEVL